MKAKTLPLAFIVFATIFSVAVPSLSILEAGTEYVFDKMWPNVPESWHFWSPRGIAVDERGTVYVVDGLNCRIKAFDNFGRLVA